MQNSRHLKQASLSKEKKAHFSKPDSLLNKNLINKNLYYFPLLLLWQKSTKILWPSMEILFIFKTASFAEISFTNSKNAYFKLWPVFQSFGIQQSLISPNYPKILTRFYSVVSLLKLDIKIVALLFYLSKCLSKKTSICFCYSISLLKSSSYVIFKSF